MHDLDLTTHLDEEGRCTTLHGVLPSRDGREALVIVNPLSITAPVPLLAAATLLAHLKTAPWRAKDVVWVLSDEACALLPTIRTWVLRYMDSHVAFARGGALQQAVIVEPQQVAC